MRVELLATLDCPHARPRRGDPARALWRTTATSPASTASTSATSTTPPAWLSRLADNPHRRPSTSCPRGRACRSGSLPALPPAGRPLDGVVPARRSWPSRAAPRGRAAASEPRAPTCATCPAQTLASILPVGVAPAPHWAAVATAIPVHAYDGSSASSPAITLDEALPALEGAPRPGHDAGRWTCSANRSIARGGGRRGGSLHRDARCAGRARTSRPTCR